MSAPPEPPAPHPRRTPRPEALAVAALTLVALAVRLAGAGWGLPQLYEEATPLKVAWGLWAWNQPHGFDGNPHTFGYPSLVFYLQFAAQALLFAWLRLTGAIHSTLDFRVLYALDRTPFALVGRGLDALFGAALVPATFALARRLGGRTAGWAAALLAAFAPALVLRATEIEVDLPVTFLVTLGGVLALRLLARARGRDAAWAGVVAGLAASSKYPGAIALVPAALALLLAPRASFAPGVARAPAGAPARSPRRGRRAPAPPAAPRSLWPARGRALLVLAAAALVAFVATSPYALLDRAQFARDWANQRQHMAEGAFGYGAGPAFGFDAVALGARLLGWPLAALAVVGIVALAGVARRREAWVAASLPVVYLAIVGSWTMKADRYLLPVVPALLAFAAAAPAWLLARAGRPRGAAAAGAYALALAACAAPLSLPYLRGEVGERFRPDTRTEAGAWIQHHAPEGAFVVVEPYAPELASFTTPEIMNEIAPQLGRVARRPRLYAVQSLPMFQVRPERSAPFYDPALYRDADLFVVTGAVRSRYAADPARFARQCAFYDSLRAQWPLVAHFPAAGHAGPEIWIHRNPGHAGWFPTRTELSGPVAAPGAASGDENFFYWNLGVNYETRGRLDLAIAAYRIALGYAPQPADLQLYASIATRLAYCLLQTRPRAAALAWLRDAAQRPAVPDEGEVLRWVAHQLELDPAQFASLAIPRLGG